jgi:hypothetical protein
MPVTLMPYAAANPPLEVDLSPLQQPPDSHLHHRCTLCTSNLSPHNPALPSLNHLSSLGSLDTPPTMSSTNNDLSSPDDTTNPDVPAPEPVFYSLDRVPAHRRWTAIPARMTSNRRSNTASPFVTALLNSRYTWILFTLVWKALPPKLNGFCQKYHTMMVKISTENTVFLVFTIPQ